MDIRNSPMHMDTAEIPFDVHFKFEDGTMVRGHKMVLAMSSDVFKRQFYGFYKEDVEGDVVIKEANGEEFQIMIDFVYGRLIDFKKMNIEVLFATVNLAEKYNIKPLREAVYNAVLDYLITEENVVTCAKESIYF